MGFEKVIVLQGKRETGKTQTLKRLIQSLQPDSENFQKLFATKKDCVVKLDYQDKVVGIITLGDDMRSLEHAFSLLQKAGGCDLYVCASRTGGRTCKYIREKFEKGTVLWVGRSYVCAEKDTSLYLRDLWETANQAQALELMKLIRNMIESDP